MKNFLQSSLYSLIIVVCGAALMAGCGNDSTSTPTAAPPASDFANLNLSCGSQTSSQQQKGQMNFQQQQSCVQQFSSSGQQQQQQFQFHGKKIADFDFLLDCDRRIVIVSLSDHPSQKQILFINPDGSIQGTLRFAQQIDDDGKGNVNCFLAFVVNFTGTASCGSTSPSPGPSASPSPGFSILSGGNSLDITALVNFDQTSDAELIDMGVEGANASPNLNLFPSPSPSPSPSVSPSPSPSPSASPSPSPSVSPSPTASVTGVPIGAAKFCHVINPCPIEGKSKLSCP